MYTCTLTVIKKMPKTEEYSLIKHDTQGVSTSHIYTHAKACCVITPENIFTSKDTFDLLA